MGDAVLEPEPELELEPVQILLMATVCGVESECVVLGASVGIGDAEERVPDGVDEASGIAIVAASAASSCTSS